MQISIVMLIFYCLGGAKVLASPVEESQFRIPEKDLMTIQYHS